MNDYEVTLQIPDTALPNGHVLIVAYVEEDGTSSFEVTTSDMTLSSAIGLMTMAAHKCQHLHD